MSSRSFTNTKKELLSDACGKELAIKVIKKIKSKGGRVSWASLNSSLEFNKQSKNLISRMFPDPILWIVEAMSDEKIIIIERNPARPNTPKSSLISIHPSHCLRDDIYKSAIDSINKH